VTSPGPIYHLALRDIHAEARASFRVHAGWSLPAHYGDAELEYRALRERAAVLDRSARSRIIVSGTDALDLLAGTFEGHLDELDEGRSMRAVRLDGRGEIRDLVLVARTGGIAYLVSGEPGQRAETLAALLERQRVDFDVRVDDRTENTCMIAIAGPAAASAFQEHLAEALPARLQLLHCVTFEFHGFRTLVIRTSDTGEDGFEMMVAPAVAQHVVETLRAAGLPLAGLDAQETARIEVCIPAFVPDLEVGLSPGEAEIDSLLEVAGGRARWDLAAVLVEPAEAAVTGAALSSAGEAAGQLRSATFSPALGSAIGLAVVEARFATPGRTLDAENGRATIVAKPFLRRRV
jgi:aminomethyltransferase